jgi:DNA-binding NtrC family response regulator
VCLSIAKRCLSGPSTHRAVDKVNSKIQAALVDSALANVDEISNIDLLGLKRSAFRVAEKHFIEIALNETDWNRIESANLLRISIKALGEKMRKYHLN